MRRGRAVPCRAGPVAVPARSAAGGKARLAGGRAALGVSVRVSLPVSRLIASPAVWPGRRGGSCSLSEPSRPPAQPVASTVTAAACAASGRASSPGSEVPRAAQRGG